MAEIRSESISSSSPKPGHDAIFSDESALPSSPPSSPPGFPWEQHKQDEVPADTPPTLLNTAFSVLGKRKALDSISQNVRPAKRAPICPNLKALAPLTQMQISLGQRVQKRCRQCGMEYIASSSEDQKLHDNYHMQHTRGYELHANFVSKTSSAKSFGGIRAGDTIVQVDRDDRASRHSKARAVLDMVEKELGAAPIFKAASDGHFFHPARPVSFEPDFRAFMYVREKRCIGFALVHRILEASQVERPERSKCADTIQKDTSEPKSALSALKARRKAFQDELIEANSQPIKLSSVKSPAVLGISRIWTSPAHRGQNLASSLLDTVVEAYNRTATDDTSPARDGQNIQVKAAMEVSKGSKGVRRILGKEQVAFSQPTAAGARLARKWSQKAYGWSVYVD